MNISYKLWFERPVRCGQVWEEVNQNGCLCLKTAKHIFLSLDSNSLTMHTVQLRCWDFNWKTQSWYFRI